MDSKLWLPLGCMNIDLRVRNPSFLFCFLFLSLILFVLLEFFYSEHVLF